MTAVPDSVRAQLALRAETTAVQVVVGAIMTNLVLGLALFVVAALIGSVLLMLAAAWLLVPMGVHVYVLFLQSDRR